MKRWFILFVSVLLLASCNSADQEHLYQRAPAACLSYKVNVSDRSDYVLAKNSTATSNIQVFTSRYENNLLKIISWLPERWDLVAVVKWSAYGNDINILGPIAAKVAPALGVISNEDAAVLAQHNPGTILRIGPTNYPLVKDAVAKGLNIQEFIGTEAELAAITRVAQESGAVIDASIYLFDHYGDPWGFEFDSPKQLQQLVDAIDSSLVKVQGIFSHLVVNSQDTVDSVNERVGKFLRVACPVAVNLATALAAEDPPIMVHWGASSELSRLRNPQTGKLELPAKLRAAADVCLSHPKINFGIRVGSLTYGSGDEGLGLQPILEWTSKVTALRQTPTTTIAEVSIGTEDGFPRFYQAQGDWGKVIIGGESYALAAPPGKNKIEIDVGPAPSRDVYMGAKVCLICDKLRLDDLYESVAVDSYNIAMCATGACSQFAEATSFSYDQYAPYCKGPVTVIDN